jgi:hypothetical protein
MKAVQISPAIYYTIPWQPSLSVYNVEWSMKVMKVYTSLGDEEHERERFQCIAHSPKWNASKL